MREKPDQVIFEMPEQTNKENVVLSATTQKTYILAWAAVQAENRVVACIEHWVQPSALQGEASESEGQRHL